MRRFMWALMLCVLAVGAGTIWYPYLAAERVSTPFEAAELLEAAGEEPLCFRSEEVDPDTVYRALEARWPYAFALHATVRRTRRPSFASRCRVPSGRRRQRHTQARLRRNASRPI